MEISSLQSHVKAAELPLEKLAANKNVSEQDKIGEACKQFEAVLLRQILSEARKPMTNTTMNPNSTANSIYNDMIDHQLAKDMSQSGAVGLAKSLQSQLVHQVLRPADAAKGVAAPVTTPSVKATNPR
jgi:peptidoglycan hydrolase FlgJ